MHLCARGYEIRNDTALSRGRRANLLAIFLPCRPRKSRSGHKICMKLAAATVLLSVPRASIAATIYVRVLLPPPSPYPLALLS